MGKVARPDIDAFEAVMEREGEGGRQRGFFVSFGYTKDAEQECAAFHKRTGSHVGWASPTALESVGGAHPT